jgi:hypothetical protein
MKGVYEIKEERKNEKENSERSTRYTRGQKVYANSIHSSFFIAEHAQILLGIERNSIALMGQAHHTPL